MSLSGLVAFRRYHDTCIVPQHVQTSLFAEKFFGRALDGRKVGEVEVEKDEFTFAVRMLLLDTLNGRGRFFFGPCCNVDLGMVLVENGAQLLADARRRTGYDEDLSDQQQKSRIRSETHFARLGW